MRCVRASVLEDGRNQVRVCMSESMLSYYFSDGWRASTIDCVRLKRLHLFWVEPSQLLNRKFQVEVVMVKKFLFMDRKSSDTLFLTLFSVAIWMVVLLSKLLEDASGNVV